MIRRKSGEIQAPLTINCKVELDGPVGATRVGIVRFIGHVHYKTGVFYGVELIDGSYGNNDGCVGEHRYFTMEAKTSMDGRRSPRRDVEKRGVFVRQFKIRRVLRGSREGSASPLKVNLDSSSTSPRFKKQKVGDKMAVEAARSDNSTVMSCTSRPNLVSNTRRKKWSKRLCPVCGIDLNINQPLGDRVLDHVLIGGFEQSQDLEGLKLSGVTHVLNCARELPNCFPETLKYLKFECADDNKQKITGCFEKAFQFMDECYDEKGVCLVHCQQGKSRSAAVIAGYLMARRGLSLSAAIERMQAVRRVARPNDNFMSQLRTFERATKRWRRNPDPKTKRLYALQSFEQPRRRRHRERERRGSHGNLLTPTRKKKQKTQTGTANERVTRRKRTKKPREQKQSISKSPLPNRVKHIAGMWSLVQEETSNNPFILITTNSEGKENDGLVSHPTSRGRKKQSSPRRGSHKVRSPREKKLDKREEGRRLKRSNEQSMWGFVKEDIHNTPKSTKILASDFLADGPPKIEVVDEDEKETKDGGFWFKEMDVSPQNLSFLTSITPTRDARLSRREVSPPPTKKKEVESPRGSYRTSRLAKSRVQRSWKPSKQGMRNNLGFSGSTIAVSQTV